MPVINKMVSENGDPAISLNNYSIASDVYGKLIGVIHSLIPVETVQENKTTLLTALHVTQLFFAQGYVHTALGFGLGTSDTENSGPNKQAALELVLQSILGLPALISLDNLKTLAPAEEVTQALKDQQELAYVFAIPEDIALVSITESRGRIAFDNMQILMEEESKEDNSVKRKIIDVMRGTNND